MHDGTLNPSALLAVLAECGVDFVVIGAMAVGVHAEVRATGDVDIMVPVGNETNKQALQDALARLQATRLPPTAGGVPADPDDPYPTIMFRTRFGKLDVLYRPDGSAPYPKVKQRALERTVGGQTIMVAGKDDMIGMKLAAGRPHDLSDVANMTVAEIGDPTTLTIAMTVAPDADRSWARAFTAARVTLFDPDARVWTDRDQLHVEARRTDLTDEQLRYWAQALADRLHGAAVLAEATVVVRFDADAGPEPTPPKRPRPA